MSKSQMPRVPHVARRMVEQVSLLAVRGMPVSVTLADPDLPDCPLVGCSDGFQEMTGYKRNDILGQNCRFLNEGTGMDGHIRRALRKAVSDGCEFIGMLPNRRADGRQFKNLLHMTTLTVQGKRYIVGVQSDVTSSDFDITKANHIEEIRSVSDRIFSANIDAWVHQQAQDFSIKIPLPYSELLRMYSMEQYIEARREFIAVGGYEVQRTSPVNPAGSASQEAARRERKITSESASTATPDQPDLQDTEDDSAFSTDCGPRSVSSGDGQRSFQSSHPGDEAHVQPESEAKSIGSVGHPDRCTECQFFFFHPGGCNKGVNCRYCHELHMRRNAKKNRKILKRLADRKAIPEEGNVTSAGHVVEDDRPSAEASGVVGLRYDAASWRGGGAAQQPRLTFVVGQTVQLHAVLEGEEATKRALQSCLIFETVQALPAGLALDSSNGEITGVPSGETERSVYAVTVSTQATGPGGIELGFVPLATCMLSMRVVDLQHYRPCGIREEESGHGNSARSGNLIIEFTAAR
mmetsp:Transcript_90118/g.285356  ORF Transcript_90118/g.285356 Transcript_90118/m.285356 type:complete len:521 (+) Transcript_90118:75-1637(+)